MMHYPLLNASHDAHHDKAGYYRLTLETLRGKMNQTDEQFRNFLLPLLGDKDQEKILESGKSRKDQPKGHEGNLFSA